MKILYSIIGLTFLMMGLSLKTEACINPDSSAWVVASYDTSFTNGCPTVNDVELRITNLRLMNEAPTKICACALATHSDIFDELLYIAFVDSGTNNPYQGFASFNENFASNIDWLNNHPNKGEWTGFVADVINSGLQANDPVELIIRFKAPDGTALPYDSTQCTPLDEKLTQSTLGTDEWDGVNEKLVFSHNSTVGLGWNGKNKLTFNHQWSGYFHALDTAILNNVTTSVKVFERDMKVNIYPNPIDDVINVELKDVFNEQVRIIWQDVLGRESRILYNKYSLNADRLKLTLNVNEYNLPVGLGFLTVKSGDRTVTKQMLRVE